MPGLFVRARIAGPTWNDVIVVPRGIVQSGNVYVFEDSLARRRTVRIERHLFDRSIVRGLQPGEIVITSNLDALYDQAPVRMERAEEPISDGDDSGDSGAGS